MTLPSHSIFTNYYLLIRAGCEEERMKKGGNEANNRELSPVKDYNNML
jgi:hypothetical protein